MAGYQNVFQRREIKYLLTLPRYTALRKELERRMEPDRYGKTTIHSIYYDTPDYRLIRSSLEKPIYKEKLRVRSYGDADPDGTVFVELKKKYRGVVYKRRTAMPLSEAVRWTAGEERPEKMDQIRREIDWFLHFYPLQPAVKLSYERLALAGREDDGLRVTFDTGIRWQDRTIRLESRADDTLQLPPTNVLMEVKAAGAFPVWLSRLFSELEIYPASYSKYGVYYRERILNEKGVVICA